jgi:MYXO-CTERM domain-containing protein
VLSFSASQTADLLGGLDYINIYTPANLGGEIRGQLIVVPEPHPGVMLLGAGALALLWRVVHRRRQINRYR